MEFSKKVKSLDRAEQSPENNAFIREGLKESNVTQSGNGAKKYSTSNDVFVDNFASISKFAEPRSYEDIAKDMYKLWSVNPEKCVKLAIYIRMITRQTQVLVDNKVSTTEDVQRGQGLKNEGILRFIWLSIYHNQAFVANLPFFISAGSWKDIFEMMSLDLQYHGWEGRKLNWNFLSSTVLAGLANENTCELVKKYLPSIRSSKDCVTLASKARSIVGKYMANRIFGKKGEEKTEDTMNHIHRKYRKFKQSGTAHVWQQLIGQGRMLEIDFNTIHGRALALLVGTKFLKNHGLVEKYYQWLASRKTVKYTGFVHELFEPLGNKYWACPLPDYQEITINKQFEQLVETARKDMDTNSRLLVVRDISSSMTSQAVGSNMSSYAIGKAMALYFSALLDGPFKDAYATFSDTCKLCKWQGKTPIEKWTNDNDSRFGSTNLQSVADMFVKLRTTMGVSENEFPTGALLISDGDFNWCGTDVANFKAFRDKLLKGGFSVEYVNNFKLILWDIPNGFYGKGRPTVFEDFADAPNNFYMSGYDPAAIAFIMGTKAFKATPKNATELFNAAMNQTLLNMVVIPKEYYKRKKK